jgi:hypothetical protein
MMMFNSAVWGLSVVSQHVQRYFSHLFADLREYVLVYVDDILIATDDRETHSRILSIVIQRLTDVGARISIKKCKFGFREIRALGMLVTPTGLRADPHKVETVMACARARLPETGCVPDRVCVFLA